MAKGKIIEKFGYYPEGRERVDVPIKMHSEYGRYWFSAEHRESGTDIREEKSIEDVNKKLKAALEAYYKITWEPMILVEVKGEEPNTFFGNSGGHMTGYELLIGWRCIQVATDPATGKKLWRLERGSGINRDSVEDSEYGSHRDSFDRKPVGTSKALIPDTPEAREKLEAIQQAMKDLAARVGVLLGPRQILSTLAAPSLKLLAGGP